MLTKHLNMRLTNEEMELVKFICNYHNKPRKRKECLMELLTIEKERIMKLDEQSK